MALFAAVWRFFLALIVLFATSVLLLLLLFGTWLGCFAGCRAISVLKDLGFQLSALPLARSLLDSLASLFSLQLAYQPPSFAV